MRSSPSWPVIHKRSWTTMGEEWPFGIFAFQTTLRLGLMSPGSPLSGETPVPLGPRKRGQSEAARIDANEKQIARRRINNSLFSLDATGEIWSRMALSRDPGPGTRDPPYNYAGFALTAR